MMRGSDYFKLELSLISNNAINEDIIKILDTEIYKMNFSKPASSTLKYHPQFANTKQGLVKHTKAVVKAVLVLLRARPDINELYRDHIIAACILHDMCKYEPDNQYTVKNHAEIMAELFSESSLLDIEDRAIITKLIRYHQGYFDQDNDINLYMKYVYNNNKPSLLGDACLLVHYADMIASRVWYGSKNVFVTETEIEEQSI